MSPSIRVLHVDDEPDFAEVAGTFLEREDDRFVVQMATSAAEGLACIEENPPDCIVSDYNMPSQNGIEFLESVREEWPDLPFILFTGQGSEEVASDAISAGVTDYLQKASGTDQYTVLANRIQNAFERVQAKQQQERQLEAIKNAQEGISILDEDGRYLFVNEAFGDIHGYDPSELLGEHWELLYPDEDVPRVRQEILPAVEDSGNWHGETTSLRADGITVEVDHTLAITDRGELVCTLRDISEKKERQQQLEQSAAKLEALFENSPDMINIHDIDGNIIDPNPRLCQKTGYDADTLTDMKIWELDQNINPSDARTLWEGMGVGDRQRLEGEYQRKSGSTFPVEVHIQRIDLAGENRFVGISRDITERKRTEKKRRQTIDRINDAVIKVDSDWQITLVNSRTEEFSGRAESELLGRDFWAVFAGARGTQFEDEYRHAMSTREDVSIVDYYSGVDEWFDIQVYPNEDGGLSFYFRTVTEYKKRQHELQRIERRYQAIFEDPNILAGVLDTDGTLVKRNHTAMEYIDAELDDVVGELFWETPWWSEETRPVVRQRVEQAAGGEYVEYEADLEEPDGTPYSVEGVIRPVTNETGDVVSLIVSARDVTQRKEREQTLKRQNERFDELASAVSHDLQTPLATALGRAELAVETGDTKQMEQALDALERVDELREDLVEVLQTKEIIGETELVDIERVGRDAWETIQPSDNASLQVCGELSIDADPDAIQRLFENLLSNAIEHGSADTTVRIGGIEGGFYVEDDGPGIPEDERGEVFTPGYSAKSGGSGVGLASVRQIVVAHGWKVQIDKSSTGGARFEITEVGASIDDR